MRSSKTVIQLVVSTLLFQNVCTFSNVRYKTPTSYKSFQKNESKSFQKNENFQKPNIFLCCPMYEQYDESNNTCVASSLKTQHYRINLTIAEDNIIKEVNISDFFQMQVDKSNKNKYYMMEFIHENTEFQLYQNGSILRKDDMATLSSDRFCLSHNILKADSNLLPAYYYIENENSNIFLYVTMSSTPFMMLSVLVIILVPEMRTIHEKSLACYLVALSLAYSLQYAINLWDVQPNMCKFLAYSSYFLFIACFFWLNVIGLHLFMTFKRKVNAINERSFFLGYSLYAWGTALFFLIITFLNQEKLLSEYELDPMSYSTDYNCWFSRGKNVAKLLFFYIPMMYMLLLNTILLIFIFFQISKVKRTYQNQHHTEIFSTIVQMYVLLGLTWIGDVLGYFFEKKEEMKWFLQAMDFWNAIQGLIIFIWVTRRKPVRCFISNLFPCFRSRAGSQPMEQMQL